MLPICPYCHGPLPEHGTCCRVPHDLDRFERVFERLLQDHDKPFLQANLLRYLIAFGRRADDTDDVPLTLAHSALGKVNSATSGAW